MKRWFTLVVMALMAVGTNAQELTVSDKHNSGCLRMTRGGEGDEMPIEQIPTIILQKEGNILSVELQNYTSNCATSDFYVNSSISEGSEGSPSILSVNVTPVTGEELADCICTFNVSFTVRDLEANSFYLKCWWYEGQVELSSGEPLVLEYRKVEAFIDGASYQLLKVMHKAMLMSWVIGEGELHIPSEVSYEGETYAVTCIASFGSASFGEKVTKVFVPKTIRSMDFEADGAIYSNPFAGCTSLESIEVDEDCPLFSSVGGVLFNKDKTMLIGYPAASPRETYTVPEWVTIVRAGAFCYSQHLRKLTIPDNVTYIGYGLFWNSKSLEEVRLPSGLEVLESNLFNNCQSLKSVQIPESVTIINNNVFEGCNALTNITLPQGLVSIGNSAFYKCSALQTLDIPKNVNRIYAGAFSGCKQLSTLCIRGVLESFCMNRDLFSGMGKQAKLYVPSSEVEKYQAIYGGDVYALEDTWGYHPLVEQGKKWTYDNFMPLRPAKYDHYYYYELKGDTLIAGKNCLKMYSDNQYNDSIVRYEGGLYEENKKVYCFYPENDEAELLYDFDCEIGDTLHVLNRQMLVKDIRTEDNGGITIKKYTLQIVWDYEEEYVYWIEGVGATKDFFAMIPASGNYNSLNACELNGEKLYQTIEPDPTDKGYHKMGIEGKRWNYIHYYLDDEGEHRDPYSYVVKGDTIIRRQTYKKLWYQDEKTERLVCLLHETGRSIYKSLDFGDNSYDMPLMRLFFDFGRDDFGRVFTWNADMNTGNTNWMVYGIDDIMVNGRQFRRYTCLQKYSEAGEDLTTIEYDDDGVWHDVWVEGVGSAISGIEDQNPFHEPPVRKPGEYTYFVSCYEDGECIFTAEDFDIPSAIKPVKSSVSKDMEIYDLRGRRLKSPSKGINIIRQSDGTTRKVVVR